MELCHEGGKENDIAPSQSKVSSERTFTLSSPSQKHWLSSPETSTDFNSGRLDSTIDFANVIEKGFCIALN